MNPAPPQQTITPQRFISPSLAAIPAKDLLADMDDFSTLNAAGPRGSMRVQIPKDPLSFSAAFAHGTLEGYMDRLGALSDSDTSPASAPSLAWAFNKDSASTSASSCDMPATPPDELGRPIPRANVSSTPLQSPLSVAAPLPDRRADQIVLSGGHLGCHFTSAVCCKSLPVLLRLLTGMPFRGHEEVVTLVEYGASQGHANDFWPSVLEQLNYRLPLSDFSIIHADSTDARALQHLSEHLDLNWQQAQSLEHRVFTYHATKPFNLTVAARHSVSIGFALLSLHWKQQSGNSSDAAKELKAFLDARAMEFKTGGLLLVAYVQRSCVHSNNSMRRSLDMSSPTMMDSPTLGADPKLRHDAPIAPPHVRAESSPILPSSKQADMWSAIKTLIAPCIQRAVALQMIRSDIARCMLDLPLYLRTAEQTEAVLSSVASDWAVEWSCGLEAHEHSAQREPVLKVLHPASLAIQARLLPTQVYAEHVLTFIRNLYEWHFRHVLALHAKLARSAVEHVLDTVWGSVREKVEDGALQNLELEVAVMALRRR